MKIRYEPARLFSLLGAVLAVLVYYGVLDEAGAQVWGGVALALIALTQGELIRGRVVPKEKVLDAGLTPAEVTERAEDPKIPRAAA